MIEKNRVQLVHADSCVFLKTLKADTIDFVLTDPPYIISRKSGFHKGGGVERFAISTEFGRWDHATDHATMLATVMQECYRCLKPGGTIVVFYDLWKLESLSQLLTTTGFRMLRFVEWLKTNPVPINSRVMYLTNAREVALVATKGSNPTFNTKYHNGVFAMPIHRDGGKRLHPTQKPLALMRQLIEIHTHPGATVLDPFAGSGTTLVAAQSLGRHVMGCELSKTYFDKATKRIREAA